MKKYFADTSYFIALLIDHDEAHAAATDFANRRDTTIITTEYVILELAAYLSKPSVRDVCIGFVDESNTIAAFTTIASSPERFKAGWDVYRSHRDKSWSLTDCISFALMRERRLAEALTTDRHFEQAGFRALLKDSRA